MIIEQIIEVPDPPVVNFDNQDEVVYWVKESGVWIQGETFDGFIFAQYIFCTPFRMTEPSNLTYS